MSDNLSLLEIIDSYLESDRIQLPPFDSTAKRIQSEVMKEDPDVALIERLIVKDQALTGQVLRLANSAFYKGLVQVTTVRNAILRLGINEVSNMVTVATQKQHFRSKDPKINEFFRKLWQHSLGCAIGAHWIAKNSGFVSLASEAFFAGLLHDVGKLVILTAIEQLKQSGIIEQQPAPALLKEIIDDQHSRYGCTLMETWNLPARYGHVAREHHSETFDAKDYLLLIVRVANITCHKAGVGMDPEETPSLSALPETTLLGLTGIDLAKLEIHLEDTNLLQM